MNIEITYKLQGNGSHSWVKKTSGFSEMISTIEVLNWKIKAVLSQRGMLTQVEEALNNLPEPQKSIALLAWEYSPTIAITSNTTKFVQEELALSIQEVTDIFKDAINIDI